MANGFGGANPPSLISGNPLEMAMRDMDEEYERNRANMQAWLDANRARLAEEEAEAARAESAEREAAAAEDDARAAEDDARAGQEVAAAQQPAAPEVAPETAPQESPQERASREEREREMARMRGTERRLRQAQTGDQGTVMAVGRDGTRTPRQVDRALTSTYDNLTHGVEPMSPQESARRREHYRAQRAQDAARRLQDKWGTSPAGAYNERFIPSTGGEGTKLRGADDAGRRLPTFARPREGGDFQLDPDYNLSVPRTGSYPGVSLLDPNDRLTRPGQTRRRAGGGTRRQRVNVEVGPFTRVRTARSPRHYAAMEGERRMAESRQRAQELEDQRYVREEARLKRKERRERARRRAEATRRRARRSGQATGQASDE